MVSGKLLAGEYPGDKDKNSSISKINALTGAGISAFIDLTGKDDDLLPYSDLLETALYQRFPIRDVSTPDSPEDTVAILNAIDHHISQERIVYLHCWGGIGRTGMIVGCWLARHGYAGQAALDRLREFWRQCPKSTYRKSPETREQEEYILNWKETS